MTHESVCAMSFHFTQFKNLIIKKEQERVKWIKYYTDNIRRFYKIYEKEFSHTTRSLNK